MLVAIVEQQVWFQNRRAKFRKTERLTQQKPSSQSAGCTSGSKGSEENSSSSSPSAAINENNNNSSGGANGIKEALVSVKAEAGMEVAGAKADDAGDNCK